MFFFKLMLVVFRWGRGEDEGFLSENIKIKNNLQNIIYKKGLPNYRISLA